MPLDQPQQVNGVATPEVAETAPDPSTDPRFPQTLPEKTKGLYDRWKPRVETDEFRSMYTFYHDLGESRSVRKVAKQFGRSVQYVEIISRAFQWTDRIRATKDLILDPTSWEVKKKADQARKKLGTVLTGIVDSIESLNKYAAKLRNGEDLSDEELRRVGKVQQSLMLFGVELHKPKDLRDILDLFKEIIEFHGNMTANAELPKLGNVTNIDKFQLVIKEKQENQNGQDIKKGTGLAPKTAPGEYHVEQEVQADRGGGQEVRSDGSRGSGWQTVLAGR